jgi:chemotaxis protein MotB
MYYAVRMFRSLTALMIFSSLGCITRAQHEATLAELEEARQSSTERGRVVSENFACGLDLGLCHDREANLRARLEAAELHDQRHRQRFDIYGVLGAELFKPRHAGELEVHWRDGLPVIALPSDLLFDSGSSKLSRQGEASLLEVAAVLARMTKQRFQVAGHTDDAPIGQQWADNWQLSTEQALTVTRFLVAQGLPPGMLSAAGYGEHDPAASNDSADTRKQNRRIELILQPDLSDPSSWSD